VAIAVVALGSFALLLSLQAVLDNDIWWHLAAGRWIAEHRAVPRTDPFSTGGEHKPWVAYAWLFELLIWWLHQHLGLLGIVAYRAGFAVAIALAAWRLVQKREPRVAVAAVITLVTIAAMRPVLTERSWLFTTLFFALSLDAIVDLREGRPRSPWPLAVGYAIWASTHIQFIYGLFAIGVGWLASVVELRRGLPVDPRAPRRLALLGGWCALATLVNPYGLRLWLTAANLGRDTAAFDFVTELQAPPSTIRGTGWSWRCSCSPRSRWGAGPGCPSSRQRCWPQARCSPSAPSAMAGS
jgi:hypothetical protein